MIVFLVGVLLADDTASTWGPTVVGMVVQAGFAGLVAWYLLTKAGPRTEEEHKKQLLEQRVDLLALVQKERETLERVLSVVSDVRFASIKDMNESVVQMHSNVDKLSEVCTQMRDELRKNTQISEEIKRSQEELRKLHEKRT